MKKSELRSLIREELIKAKTTSKKTLNENFVNAHDAEPDVIEDNKVAFTKAKPIPLTGDIKKDTTNLIKYLKSKFKDCAIELDFESFYFDSDNFGNELYIPVKDNDEYEFGVVLDYDEIIYQDGDNIKLFGTFIYNAEDINIYIDLSSVAAIKTACNKLQKRLSKLK